MEPFESAWRRWCSEPDSPAARQGLAALGERCLGPAFARLADDGRGWSGADERERVAFALAVEARQPELSWRAMEMTAAGPIATFEHARTGLELRLIPGRRAGEEAQLRPFLIARTVVSARVWRSLEPGRRAVFGLDHPMVEIGWYDAKVWLTRAGGLRLPREKEWEHAARFGHEGRLSAADQQGSPRVLESRWEQESPGPIAGGATNALGLVDMLGQVREWCEDLYTDPRTGLVRPEDRPYRIRVLRGGGWRLRASECVLGHRDEALPQRGDPMTGLRPAADVRIGETSGGGDRR